YAVTQVKADEGGWAVLRCGCAGACQAWVNGVKAGAVDNYHDYGADKMSVSVYLHKGWNQVLIKSGTVEGTDWAFSARLCSASGGPFPGLTVDPSNDALKAYLAESKDRKAPTA